MGRKQSITKEMLVSEGLEILREIGPQGLTANIVAKRLNCSTQPLKYHFGAIEDYRNAIYYDAYMFLKNTVESWVLDGSVGNAAFCYVKFAHEEPNVYNFLFTNTKFINENVFQLTSDYSVVWFMEKVLEDFTLDKGEEAWCYEHVFFFLHGLSKYVADNPAYPFVDEEIKIKISQHLAGINLAFNKKRLIIDED